MPTPRHPLHDQVLDLLRTGQASVAEIARATGVDRDVVKHWRRRAGIAPGIKRERLAQVARMVLDGIPETAPAALELKARISAMEAGSDV